MVPPVISVRYQMNFVEFDQNYFLRYGNCLKLRLIVVARRKCPTERLTAQRELYRLP